MALTRGAALLLAALAALSLAAPARALYSASSPVVQLTPEIFESKIKGRGGVWIVEFYAPW
jgi:protein disulfide-isomerase A6